MRLSEAITIYLAAGAPFGFRHFLCRYERSAGRPRSFYGAARAALFWPLAAALLLFPRRGTAAVTDEKQLGERVSRAQGKLLSSLYKLAELAQSSLAQSSPGAESAKVERVVRTVREAAEKYIGLTLAAAESDPDGPLGQRELELYRVAGRKGQDLLLAGRCVRRRNAARLVKHQSRSRLELLHALAEIREAVSTSGAKTNDLTSAHHASVALVRLYACALNLLSLLEDEAGAAGVSRLLDAECARLRRLEATKDARAAKEETCTAYTTRIVFNDRPQTRSLSSS